MSIKIMSLVWEKSKHRGSALLLMLALADHADDKGRCWPGMTSLGLKTRMGRRNVVKLMERLEKSGEVIVEVRGGQSASNRYRINVDLLSSDQLNTSEHAITTPSVPAITRVVNRRSHESSLTIKKPSKDTVDTSASKTKTRDIQAAYESCVTYPIDWKAGEGHAAKWLAEHGYTPDDVRACYAEMRKDQFWSDKPLSLSSVKNRIGQWKVTRQSKQTIKLTGVVNA